jgi:hypothetical protein
MGGLPPILAQCRVAALTVQQSADFRLQFPFVQPISGSEFGANDNIGIAGARQVWGLQIHHQVAKILNKLPRVG